MIVRMKWVAGTSVLDAMLAALLLLWNTSALAIFVYYRLGAMRWNRNELAAKTRWFAPRRPSDDIAALKAGFEQSFNFHKRLGLLLLGLLAATSLGVYLLILVIVIVLFVKLPEVALTVALICIRVLTSLLAVIVGNFFVAKLFQVLFHRASELELRGNAPEV